MNQDKFYSTRNFYLLKSIACKVLQDKSKYTLKSEYDKLILNIMEQANDKVPSKPDHITSQIYVKELNKRVLDVIISKIELQVEVDKKNIPVQLPKVPEQPYYNKQVDNTYQQLSDDRNREMAQQSPAPVNFNAPKIDNYNTIDHSQLTYNPSISNDTKISSIDKLHQDSSVMQTNQPNNIETNMDSYFASNADNQLNTNGPQNIETAQNNLNNNYNSSRQQAQPIQQPTSQSSSQPMQQIQQSMQDMRQMQQSMQEQMKTNYDTIQQSINFQRDINYTNERPNNIMQESPNSHNKLFNDVNYMNNVNKAQEVPNTAINHYPIVTPQRVKQIERFDYITVDSRDRDLSRFPNPNHFEVKFSPTSDSFDIPTSFDTKGVIRWGNAVRYEADNKGATINKEFDNVLSFECIQALFPSEPRYIFGRSPNIFNVATATEPHTAIIGGGNSDNIGVSTSLLDESYLLLSIDEIDGPYSATSDSGDKAIAKLVHDGVFGSVSPFIKMKSMDGEYKLYTPTTLGKINKLTITAKKHNNLPFDFGVDKLHVASTTIASAITSVNICEIVPPGTQDYVSITVNLNHTDYQDGCIEGHALKPGDLIYMYSTIPDLSEFTLTNLDMSYTRNGANVIEGAATYNGTATEVDFSHILKIGDFIKYNNTITRVASIDASTNNVTITGDISTEPSSTSNFGFYRVKKRGKQSIDKAAIHYIDGVRVISVTNETTVIINYPHDKLGDLLKTSHTDPLLANELFFIKHKMQVSYTFKIIVMEKDYEQIKSNLNT
jgi:hypothetical protein